jgi:hypothetical protein
MSRTQKKIPEGAVLAVLDAYPGGAERTEIADALGVTRECVRLWERDAVFAFIIGAGRIGLDVRELLASLHDAADHSTGTTDPRERARTRHRLDYAAKVALIEAESMRMADSNAVLFALLDEADDRARRASLVLGEFIDAERTAA